MTRGLKETIKSGAPVKKIESSMGLKFVVAMTGVVSVLMVIGTLFTSRMLMKDQYSAIETRGRELGLFIGKASSDHILFKDILAVDALVSEAVKASEDMLYTVILDPSGTTAMSTVIASFSPENPEVRAFLRDAQTGDVVQLVAKAKEKFNPIEITTEIRVEGANLGVVKMGYSRERVKENARKIVWLLLGTSVVIVTALSALVYGMVRRMIVSPTVEAEAVASNIASGDLTQTVHVRSVDELGRLGRGLNRMIIGLKEMIASVRETALNVGSVSGQVKEISEKVTNGSRDQAEAVEEAASSVNEMHFSLKEIAANVEDLHGTSERTSSSAIETSASVAEVARTMSDLSTSIEETSTAITQMSAAIHQTAENVEQLSSAAEETAASASEINASVREVESNANRSASIAEAVAADAQQLGMRSIEKTIEGMRQIEANARRTAEAINLLGERAESIGGILTVIEDITDQTGLLALNAAILAAQAGEHGKGFAVVAAEIRELANRTASSTQEIGKLIASVQDGIREAVKAMREEVSIVEEGTRLSVDAGAALKKILERANESRDMSRGISKAAAEQTRGVKQVSEAVDRINSMTHQIAKATSEQKSGSEQITRATERMREITRFVKTSADEQAKGSRDITAAVESMSAKIALVNRAAGEVQSGSELIVKAIERIKAIAKENAGLAAGLNDNIDALSTQSVSLKKELEKFRT